MSDAYNPIPRFFTKFSERGKRECWNWRGTISEKTGYGYFWVAGRGVRAHRFAYEIANKVKLTPDVYVLHKCDNPSCVNPNHLFTGDALDNALDAMSKRRHMHGEAHGMAKLSDKDVRYIREQLKSGIFRPGARLARQFGVSRSIISKINVGKNWTHL